MCTSTWGCDVIPRQVIDLHKTELKGEIGRGAFLLTRCTERRRSANSLALHDTTKASPCRHVESIGEEILTLSHADEGASVMLCIV